MIAYLLTYKGIYTQDMLGIFSDLELAISQAKKAVADEKNKGSLRSLHSLDRYHTVECHKFIVNDISVYVFDRATLVFTVEWDVEKQEGVLISEA